MYLQTQYTFLQLKLTYPKKRFSTVFHFLFKTRCEIFCVFFWNLNSKFFCVTGTTSAGPSRTRSSPTGSCSARSSPTGPSEGPAATCERSTGRAITCARIWWELVEPRRRTKLWWEVVAPHRRTSSTGRYSAAPSLFPAATGEIPLLLKWLFSTPPN